MAKFQVKLAGDFKDYANDEDKILKRAYMAGFHNVKFTLRGQSYIYDFRKMVQVNKDSGKERRIRQPKKWKAPLKPLVPAGPTTVVNVPRGSPGTTIQVPHPRVKGAFISVNVPASAKAGQAMLVPVPAAAAASSMGSSAPRAAESSSGSGGWTTGGKVAAHTAFAAGVFGGAVGGAILGEHIAPGGLDATVDAAGDGIVDAAEATADFAVDAGEAVADFAVDAGEAVADFAVDAGEFIVDAGEDVGDFVMDLF